MSRVPRLELLCALVLALSGVVASSAGAVTWHNSGDTAFTATGGATTFSVGANNLTCTSDHDTGTLSGSVFSGPLWDMAHGTITYTGCLLAGQATGVHCNYTFTATAFDVSGDVTGTDHMDCAVTISTFLVCRLTGAVPVTYRNPSGTSNGSIRFPTTAALTASNGAVSCPLGTGATTRSPQNDTITNATGGASSPHRGPVISRTA